MASSNSYNSPCAACKFLRRKCMPGCIFAPYFPPEEPQKFANVHKIFGASNVTKLLNELLPHQREDAVNSLAYEAEARVRDPVYGCVGAISFLQRQVERLQKELDTANADLIRYGSYAATCCNVSDPHRQIINRPVVLDHLNMNNITRNISEGSFYQTPPPSTNFSFPNYPLPWNSTSFENPSAEDHNNGGGAGGGGI